MTLIMIAQFQSNHSDIPVRLREQLPPLFDSKGVDKLSG